MNAGNGSTIAAVGWQKPGIPRYKALKSGRFESESNSLEGLKFFILPYFAESSNP